MAKNTPLPIPLDRWFIDVKRIEELRTILDSPTFQEAALTLKEVAGPSFSALDPETSTNSQRLAWYAGYRDAFADLHKLTKVRADKQTQPINTEWNHIQTQP